MTRAEVDKILSEKIDEIAGRHYQSRRECIRQLLVAGIRAFGDRDFLNPYPEKQTSNQ